MSSTPKTDSEHTAKYREKRKSKRLSIDMYLDDDFEKNIYENWQKEENKKQLFIEMYSAYLSKNLDNEKRKK
ncbi:hypothetical protein N5J48_04300 [Acinetobacter ursingii]|uniref:Uncharacterized protein n=1 Tax=Acinetobacter ursingii TaxID=108980 RepID=A0AA46NSI1_9GAMM|nr:hypothetical protein [Acinetobacter ursingii]MDG9859393.1 hypothetical protein [Acinetobacter ursingii]MDG9894921.1 hypothetical protein [Acinetobacter ursingii]MDH0006613.1 hypothetical protein [Acinetobacter ursingii]MDH0478400.1 hypothetical protein [Acinetobacter ursingii]MDH2118983.1 hypothetical protein [Acinetobacter ursingii]